MVDIDQPALPSRNACTPNRGNLAECGTWLISLDENVLAGHGKGRAKDDDALDGASWRSISSFRCPERSLRIPIDLR
jgi:hypothetical protein